MSVDSLYEHLAEAMTVVKTTRAAAEVAATKCQATVATAQATLGEAQRAHADAISAASVLRAELDHELSTELGDNDRVRVGR